MNYTEDQAKVRLFVAELRESETKLAAIRKIILSEAVQVSIDQNGYQENEIILIPKAVVQQFLVAREAVMDAEHKILEAKFVQIVNVLKQ